MSINRAAPSIATTLPGSLTDEAIAVRGALLARGLETPMINNGLNRDQRYEVIREAFGVSSPRASNAPRTAIA